MRKLVRDDSSNVRSVTYDVEEGCDVGYLVVEFKSGGHRAEDHRRYRYGECTLDDFREACVADSLGRWVRGLITRKTPAGLVEKLMPDVAKPSQADLHLMALRTIASVADGAAADFARQVLAESPTPPLPPEFPSPYPDVRHVGHSDGETCGSSCTHLVRWNEGEPGGAARRELGAGQPDLGVAIKRLVGALVEDLDRLALGEPGQRLAKLAQMTPDEAYAVAHAILVASVGAR